MKTAVVICPGRGTYNAGELGYLKQRFQDKALLRRFDEMRTSLDLETLSSLDGAERFSLAKHSRGDNASALIFAATLGDFLAIDRTEIDIVAVTGNSMGWYSALTLGGALSPEDGFTVVNTMGALMQAALIGGQTVYPFVDDEWRKDDARKSELLSLIDDINSRADATLAMSIDLGGMLVIAGDVAGLDAFERAVPRIQERFPMRLGNHAAFHTALQAPVAAEGRKRLAPDLFRQPQFPLIDGRGKIWQPDATEIEELWRYTLDDQVVKPYDFTHAVRIAAREFAPDYFIVTGPGATLGGAVAQSLILSEWRGMTSKADFQALQNADPFLISMGRNDQSRLVTKDR